MAELNSSFFRSFYNETLFVTRNVNANEPEPGEDLTFTGPEIIYTQAAFKGLVILISENENVFQQILQNEFLTKILKAIKFEMNEVAFVKVASGTTINLASLSKKLPLKNVIGFGADLLDLEKVPAPYKHFHIGSTPVLLSETLTQLEADQNKKRLLWSGLQAMFL